MLTETYDIQELDTEGRESDPLALSLIDKLNLVGQLTETGRISFNVLTADQTFVINNLFPSSSGIESYSAGGIPLRVLELYDQYKDDYKYWTVRHAPPAKIVDPILLAHNQEAYTATGNISNNNIFLIARWGDALISWSELYERASVVCRKRMLKGIQLIKAKVDTDIAMLEAGHQPDRQEVGYYSPLFS